MIDSASFPSTPALLPGDPRIPAKYRLGPAPSRSALSPVATDASLPPDLLIRSHLTSWSGYGQVAAWLGKSVEALGVSVGYNAITCETKYGDEDQWTASRRRNGFGARRCRLQAAGPHVKAPPGTDAIYTMWETSLLGRVAVENLNSAPRVIVPCRWNAEGFRNSGVVVPIDIVPLGVDTDTFRPVPFLEGGPFVVGMAGRLSHGGQRKGLAEGISAFMDAFQGRRDVRLEIKTMPDNVDILAAPVDSRIAVVSDPFRREQLAKWYAGLDALLVPSKSEGFGLHTIEAMSVGRPVIVSRETGTAEFFTEECGWALDGLWETAGDIDLYSGLGDWFAPSHESMVEALRAASTSPDEVRKRGAAAAKRAAEFTWWRAGERLIDVLGLKPKSRRLFAPYDGPLPDCVHARRGLAGSCNPIRCTAHHGTTCGGSHAPPEHCQTCAHREPTP